LGQIKLRKVILALESGSRPKGGINNSDSEVPSLGAEHLNGNGGFNFKKIKFVSRHFYDSLTSGKIEINDILVVKDGATTGKVSFVNTNFPYEISSINEHVFRLKIDSKVCIPKYVFWFLFGQVGQRQILMDFRGATVGGISRAFVEKVSFPLISLHEQLKIVDKLDLTDQIRQKRKKAIELLDEYLRSVFYDMFGDPVKNEKGWEVKKFGEIGKLDRGRSKHRPRNAPHLLGGKYPLIQTGEISNAGGYITEYKQTYSDIGLKQSRMWPAGTLCITIAANIAKTAILTFDACFPDSIVGFTPNKSIVNVEYIQFWMSYLQKMLEEQAPQSAQKNINLEILRKLKVPLPPVEMQIKFSSIVEQVEKTKAKMQESLQEMDNLFNSLMQQAFKR